MGSTILQIIEVRCPGLYADAGRDIYIELAENRISSCYYKNNYNLAVALQACHDYTVSQRNGDSGTISSKKEGDLSISYSSITTDNGNDLDQTSFGMEFKRLQKQMGSGAVSVVGAQNKPCLNPGIVPCE